MSNSFQEDLTEMKRKLSEYIDKGLVIGNQQTREEPEMTAKLDKSKFKSLERIDGCDARFYAVDCSTRTLKRANNWGVYLMRAAYALVKEREVDWDYKERLYAVLGDARTRSNFLTDVRIELESKMALELLQTKPDFLYYEHTNPRSNYLLLDGGGYFGGERKFRVALYEKCEKDAINLLAISKNSPSLHDEKGRDFIASTSTASPYDIWVYHPVRKADKDKSLYGNITIVKLCKDSNHVFRCDIMEYLTNREVSELLSPLTCISEDPRCVGYPVTLLLAHEFSAPSDSMLLAYHDQIEETLDNEGLLETLRNEEISCKFADELHGIRYPFEWEMIEYV